MIAAAHVILDLLVRSLWQGGCIAVAAVVAVRAAGQRLNASTRCVLMQIALLTVVLVPLLMAVPPLFQSSASPLSVTIMFALLNVPLRWPPAHQAVAHSVSVTTSDAVAVGLVAAWLCGALLLILRLVAGSVRLVRLVRGSRAIGQRNGVALHASVDARVPLAFGLRAPMVLVPEFLAQTRGDALECALLHEIAHIRRHDAWLNAAERITHAILFFHPGVIYLLRAIALERESACDDWAVARFGDLDGYVRNLAHIALSSARGSSLPACGAAGFHHATVSRVRRLTDVRRNGATRLSRFAIGGFSMIVIALVVVFQAFVPAIAFVAPSTALAFGSGTSPCSAFGAGPKLGAFPIGLTAKVDVDVEKQNVVPVTTIVSSSGSQTFDEAVRSYLAQNVARVACSTVRPELLHFTVASVYSTKWKAERYTITYRYSAGLSTWNVASSIAPDQHGWLRKKN